MGCSPCDPVDPGGCAEFRPELEGRAPGDVHAYWMGVAADAGFQQIGVRAADANAQTLASARSAGVSLRGWGVRDLADLHHLVELGAVGATVDWPAEALAALA